MTTNSGNSGASNPGNVATSGTNVPNTQNVTQNTPNLPDFSTTKHKVKINGTESEVSYKDLIDGYQLKNLSLTKLNESNAEMKAAKEFMKFMQENPVEAFKKAGIDPRKWANQYLLDDYEQANLSPEEKERRALLAELEGHRNKENEAKKQQELAQAQEIFNSEMANIEKSMMRSLETSGLPKNETTIKMIAQRMLEYHKAGYTDVTVEDVIPDVKDQFQTLLNSFYSNSTDDQLLGMLGDDYTKRVISAKTKTFKQNQTFSKPKPAPKTEIKNTKPAEKKTPDQYMKEIQAKFNPKK